MRFIKCLLSLCLLFFVIIKSEATPNDSISTKYANGEFSTYCQLSISANDSITNEVVNLFVKQMCNDIRGLFKWGLKGMGLANEEDELIVFDFKETRYSKQTGIIKGIGDVHVKGVTTFKDLSVDTKLTQRSFKGGRREVRLDLASPNLFIRSLRGSFYFVPKGTNKNGYLQIVTNIRFAWFFDVFITQKTYKTIMEWRIRQMLKNIKEESEKRTKMINS
jgi:hypothetical protein